MLCQECVYVQKEMKRVFSQKERIQEHVGHTYLWELEEVTVASMTAMS